LLKKNDSCWIFGAVSTTSIGVISDGKTKRWKKLGYSPTLGNLNDGGKIFQTISGEGKTATCMNETPTLFGTRNCSEIPTSL
jgi:hypothetical protein